VPLLRTDYEFLYYPDSNIGTDQQTLKLAVPAGSAAIYNYGPFVDKYIVSWGFNMMESSPLKIVEAGMRFGDGTFRAIVENPDAENGERVIYWSFVLLRK
jgi:hypothetical protein